MNLFKKLSNSEILLLKPSSKLFLEMQAYECQETLVNLYESHLQSMQFIN